MAAPFGAVRPDFKQTGDTLRITFPAGLSLRRITNALVLAVFGVVLMQRAVPGTRTGLLYTIAGAAFIVAGFAAALRREYVDVSREGLIIGHAYGPIRRGKRYSTEQVRDLREVPASPAKARLAFDTEQGTVRFAHGLTTADANAVRERIVTAAPDVGRHRTVLGLDAV